MAFALALDSDGKARTLPETMVLASLMCAVEGERGRRTLLSGRGAERLEAISPVYWPLLVLPAPGTGRFAVFDGAGVWGHSFQHTVLPALSELRDSLANPPPSAELPGWLRAMVPAVTAPTAVESMTIEGALPVEVPLFADILSQSGFRTEPLSPRAGFLPMRRPVEWYEAVVAQLRRSLEQFDAERGQLEGLRAQTASARAAAMARLEEERRQLQFEAGDRARMYAYAEMDREADAVRRTLRDHIQVELERIRSSHREISGARAASQVAEASLRRSELQGPDAANARAQIRAAADAERAAVREIAAARKRIEGIHERERQAYQVLTDRVAFVEQRGAQELAAQTVLASDVARAFADLDRAIATQIERRAGERRLLSEQFVGAPALQGVRMLWFPLWVAVLSGDQGSRTIVYPPMRVRTGIGVGDSIKTLFGGVVLPLEPMTARFSSALKGPIEQALARDPWLSQTVRTLVGTADVTADPEFLGRFASGLQELRTVGWLTPDQEHRYYEAATQTVRSRQLAQPSSAAAALGPEPRLGRAGS